MITYVTGDLFQSPANVLVNTVNTVGVMGKGIASEFKRIYPEMFERYQTLCEKKQFNIGQLWLYKTPHKWILNFPTKVHWRAKSHPEYIEAGLKKFVATYSEKDITSISFPQLGCGNGELDWESQVKPLMERYLKKLPITIYIHLYERKVVPEHRDVDAIKTWLEGEPRALAFTEFWDDLDQTIKTKHEFETFDTQTQFQVTIDQQQNGIEFRPQNGASFFIQKEEDGLLDLWQYIRAAGYCLPDKLPAGLDTHASYLVGLLAELDYMKPVVLTRLDGEVQVGLQLIPKLSDISQRESDVDAVTLVQSSE